jgi:hypothetical protein
MLWHSPREAGRERISAEVYWHPRSEWKSAAPAKCREALPMESATREACMESPSTHPMIFLEKRSMTTER